MRGACCFCKPLNSNAFRRSSNTIALPCKGSVRKGMRGASLGNVFLPHPRSLPLKGGGTRMAKPFDQSMLGHMHELTATLGEK